MVAASWCLNGGLILVGRWFQTWCLKHVEGVFARVPVGSTRILVASVC